LFEISIPLSSTFPRKRKVFAIAVIPIPNSVIPAKAGIHIYRTELDSRFCGNDRLLGTLAITR
jgi:hypothetical protein